MTKNQYGSLEMSLLLFALTITIVLTSTMGLFKLNLQAQTVLRQYQAKPTLMQDLVRQAKIGSTLRNSIKDSRNSKLYECVFAPSGCQSSSPREFVLNSPISDNPPIAGTTTDRVTYYASGELCEKSNTECKNLAISYFSVTSDALNIWVVTQQVPENGSVNINLKPAPNLSVRLDEILNFKY